MGLESHEYSKNYTVHSCLSSASLLFILPLLCKTQILLSVQCKIVLVCMRYSAQGIIDGVFTSAVELPYDDVHVFNTMIKELTDVIPEWYNFCLSLGVKDGELAQIRNQVTCKDNTRKMLKCWINADEEVTIQKILETLKSPNIMYIALAADLEDNETVKEMLKRNTPDHWLETCTLMFTQ